MGCSFPVARFTDRCPSTMELDVANRAGGDIFSLAHAEIDSTDVTLWGLDLGDVVPDDVGTATSALCDCLCHCDFVCLRTLSVEARDFTRHCQLLRRAKPLDMGIRSYGYRCARRTDVVLPKT